MANRKPIVLVNGQLQELQGSDTLLVAVGTAEAFNFTNGELSTIARCTPVYVSAANTVKKARSNASGTTRVVGLVSSATIASLAIGAIQRSGVLTATLAEWDAVDADYPGGGPFGLTVGVPYYLSDVTAGKITATAPSTAGSTVSPIGLAISQTELLIDTYQVNVKLT